MAQGKTFIALPSSKSFEARNVYWHAYCYACARHNGEEVEKLGFSRSEEYPQWSEQSYKFLKLGTEVRLRRYSYPCEYPKKGLPTHMLDIEISGKDEARQQTIRKLEILTGIQIKEFEVEKLN